MSSPEVSDISKVANVLSSLLEEALYLDKKFDHEKAFTELGMDSIVGVEFIRSINQHFGINLEATKLYDHPNLKNLSAYIASVFPAPEESSAGIDAGLPTLSSPPEKKAVSLPRERDLKGNSGYPDDPIAIIGLSGRYPRAEHLDELWERLTKGENCIDEVPAGRWDTNLHYHPDENHPHRVYAKWLGSLSGIDLFDPTFFGISPAEAELMDPQHRIFLEECWKALEDAGYAQEQLNGLKCGTYVGLMSNEYALAIEKAGIRQYAQAMTGNAGSIFAARLAYLLNLKGPAISIDTACSSSLVAIHLACQALRNQEVDLAVAGGASLYLGLEPYRQMCAAGMLSKDGKCKTFDNRADGFVPGEGAGVVVLKRLREALRDGDPVKGVILGSGINQDGKTNGITAPSVHSQVHLLKEIYTKFGIDPETITYVEAHGTGTKLGDPIEAEALTKAFRAFTDKKAYCGLGSVKTNIGHTSAAAGVAGLTKVLLQFRHGQLAPSIHFEQENEHIQLGNSAFYINTSLKDWKSADQQPRRAAVSSFGFSGTNAHLVVEEYLPPEQPGYASNVPAIILLSAKNEERLKEQVRNLRRYLELHPHTGLHDIAYTLQTGRTPMEERLAIIADSRQELREQLDKFLTGTKEDLLSGNIKKNDSDSLYKGKAAQSYVEKAIEEQDTKALARWWVQGRQIDWNLLYSGQKPAKISLPAYPFAKERYWFDSYTKKAKSSHPGAEKKDKETVPALWNQEAIRTLKDHQIGEELIVSWLEGGIALVQMNARSSRNMFTRPLVLSLQKAFFELKASPELKVVVLTGYDDIFCMGGSRQALNDIADKQSRFTDMPFLYRGLLDFDVPVISAIQGHAFGGGLLFGLYGDIVLLSVSGTYTANFMKYGFTPGMGATYILGKKLGEQLGTEMMYTAKLFSGEQLKTRGAGVIITKDVLKEALQMARELSNKPRKALEVLKRKMSRHVLDELLVHVEEEERMHQQTFHNEEVKDNIRNHFNTDLGPTGLDASPARQDKVGLQDLNDMMVTNKDAPSDVHRTKNLVEPEKVRKVPGGGIAPIGNATQSLPAVLDVLKEIFEETLHIPAAELEEDAPYSDLGIDSISGLEIIRNVNEQFALSLNAVVLYKYYTLNKLAGLVIEESGWLSSQLEKLSLENSVAEADPPVTLDWPIPPRFLRNTYLASAPLFRCIGPQRHCRYRDERPLSGSPQCRHLLGEPENRKG